MSRAVEPLPSWADIVAVLAEQGIGHVGVAPAVVLARARTELYRRRDLGYADEMAFTYRNPDRSTDPSRAVAGARSIIVAALAYGSPEVTGCSHDRRPAPTSSVPGRVARYAWADYYGRLRDGLGVVAARLKAAGERAVVFADDNSLVDREVAYLGGLGWFGKNANLLLPGGGSFFVLGSIVTTAEYEPSTEPLADGCGSCRRCLDGCPTGAIVAPGVVDARRCLAWLVQRAGPFPDEFRIALGDRFYGCDDCQEVCPPAVRFGRRLASDAASGDATVDDTVDATVDMVYVLNATDDELIKRYGRWYVAGRDPRWWRRNALIIIGNSADPTEPAVRNLVGNYRDGDDPVLAEHASWALRRLDDRARQAAVGTPLGPDS